MSGSSSTTNIFASMKTKSVESQSEEKNAAEPRLKPTMVPLSSWKNCKLASAINGIEVSQTIELIPISLHRCSYLPQRYPSLFHSTPTGIHNSLTHETFDITTRPLPEDPMATAARLIQDDLAIMFEKPDGQYYLLAGSILLAGFWRLNDKFGMPLSEIHNSGDVPGFKPKLEKGMMNFFRRIQPGQPVLRNNYFIQVDDNLAWSHSIGSEDPVSETDSGTSKQAEGWGSAAKNKAIEHHYFRSERQSLRRLPRSGGVVFTIRTYFEPMTKVAEEVGVPGRLASAVRSWGEDVSRYKGRERYGEVLLEFLDGKHREQVERGVVREDGEECEGKYPF